MYDLRGGGREVQQGTSSVEEVRSLEEGIEKSRETLKKDLGL